jgi:hypothetical protein
MHSQLLEKKKRKKKEMFFFYDHGNNTQKTIISAEQDKQCPVTAAIYPFNKFQIAKYVTQNCYGCKLTKPKEIRLEVGNFT